MNLVLALEKVSRVVMEHTAIGTRARELLLMRCLLLANSATQSDKLALERRNLMRRLTPLMRERRARLGERLLELMSLRPQETRVETGGAVRRHRRRVRALTALDLGLAACLRGKHLLAQLQHLRLEPCDLRLRRARQRRAEQRAVGIGGLCNRVDHRPDARAAARAHHQPPLDRPIARRTATTALPADTAAPTPSTAPTADAAPADAPADGPASATVGTHPAARLSATDGTCLSGALAQYGGGRTRRRGEALGVEPLVRLARDAQFGGKSVELGTQRGTLCYAASDKGPDVRCGVLCVVELGTQQLNAHRRLSCACLRHAYGMTQRVALLL